MRNGRKEKEKRAGRVKEKAGSINALLSPFELAYDGVAGGIHKGADKMHSLAMFSDKAGGSSGCSKRKRKRKIRRRKAKVKREDVAEAVKRKKVDMRNMVVIRH